MQEKVLALLSRFHQGYVDRDITVIDPFAEDVFVNSPETVILGTSNGELCVGFEASKELVHLDWKGWGDVRFDVDNAFLHPYSEMTWFALKGTLALTFSHTEEKFGDLVQFVNEELATAELSPLEGLSIINWALTMFSFAREGEERKYLWPITLTGAVVEEGGGPKFKYMQFSVPCSTHPDHRVGTAALDRRYAAKAFDLKGIEQSPLREQALLAAKQVAEGEGTFDQASDPMVITAEGDWCCGLAEAQQAYGGLAAKWGEMKLDLDNALVQTVGDCTYVVCSGEMVKTETADSALRERINEVRGLIESGLPPREKLFVIQRDIASTLKEVASGEVHRWPCRMEVVFSHGSDQWLVNHLQLSFPYYWIFEGKIDAKRV